MSMHKKPLTKLEHDGLLAHGLDIGTPSQLSDVFRQGIAFALANNHDLREALEELVEWIELGESESGFLDKSRKALSATPAESLQAHERLIEAAKVAVNDLRELAGDCNCNDDYAKRLEEAIKSYEVE